MRKFLLLLVPLFFPPSLQGEVETPTFQEKSEQLVLYYMPSCPYCKPVVAKIKREKLPVTLKNVSSNSAYHKELIAKGGKAQVPCLLVNGRAMYESSDIMDYLDKNF
ncbi:MAG: glutathione S-transferase N-terminal domain-containing protein [Chlamydiales bacterium]